MNRKIFVISYDLRSTFWRNYNGFYGALRSYPHWMHHIENTWLISVPSNTTAVQIYNQLAPYIFADCHILIIEVNPTNYYGILPPDAWTWIETNKLPL